MIGKDENGSQAADAFGVTQSINGMAIAKLILH